MPDRYPFTSVEDAGLGADEFGGPRRFTRPCERITPTTAEAEDDVLDPRVRLRMHDRAADLLHEAVLPPRAAQNCRLQYLSDGRRETPQADPHREQLRDLAFAVKDAADELARSHNLRTDLSGQKEGPGSVAADSEAGRSHPQPN